MAVWRPSGLTVLFHQTSWLVLFEEDWTLKIRNHQIILPSVVYSSQAWEIFSSETDFVAAVFLFRFLCIVYIGGVVAFCLYLSHSRIVSHVFGLAEVTPAWPPSVGNEQFSPAELTFFLLPVSCCSACWLFHDKLWTRFFKVTLRLTLAFRATPALFVSRRNRWLQLHFAVRPIRRVYSF